MQPQEVRPRADATTKSMVLSCHWCCAKHSPCCATHTIMCTPRNVGTWWGPVYRGIALRLTQCKTFEGCVVWAPVDTTHLLGMMTRVCHGLIVPQLSSIRHVTRPDTLSTCICWTEQLSQQHTCVEPHHGPMLLMSAVKRGGGWDAPCMMLRQMVALADIDGCSG